jgi:predicted RNA-binding Zn-ribbon protein involved in translation (DUF1610 family)
MGANRRYPAEELAEAASSSVSFAGVLRYLGLRQAGGTQSHIAKRIRHYGIDTSHFTGQSHERGKLGTRRRTAQQVLVVRPEGSLRETPAALRRALVEIGRPYICAHCGLDPREVPLTLHVDHVNGDWLDNRAENVRFLCPNCHAMTPTYCVPRKGP